MKLVSRIYGTGRPLLVLHGLFGMNDNWQTHAKNYAELGFEVHAIDQRNHGQSPQSADFNYQLMADDLLEYMTDHQLKKASILGHSMGGKVAMLFAAQHPQKVEKLLVVDIAPKAYPLHHQLYFKALGELNFATLKSRSEADDVLKKYVDNLGVRQFLLKNLYWKEKGELALRFNLAAIEANIEMVGEPLFEAANFTGETLFIRGALSGYIKDEDEELIHHHFPMAHLYTVANAGHWVHAEAPEEFADVSSRFLLGMFV